MMRKARPEFPATHHFIKPPESQSSGESVEEEEPLQRRQQLINFGHSQWGFNNWSWAVTKQDLDFVELSNGAYCAGVVSFVSVSVKSLDIHRENIGYATARQPYKGAAIHSARKCAVTNALRETLLSFGGSVSTELLELLDAGRSEQPAPNNYQNPIQNQNPVQNQTPVQHPPPVQNQTPVHNLNHLPDTVHENNQNTANKQPDKNVVKVKKEEAPVAGKVLKNIANPPAATAHPIPVNLPPMANRPQPTANTPANTPRAPQPAPLLRPNSNVSFVLQPVMGGVVPPNHVTPYMYSTPPRLAPPPPPMFQNLYDYSGPWHFSYEPYERHHGNVNLNFNMPPKNLVVNGRSGSVECKREEHYNGQGCWIKPTIFYDGFWTEQKVKKWVAEQVEKQFPDDCSKQSPPDPAHNS